MSETQPRRVGRPTSAPKPGQKSTIGVRVSPALKEKLDAASEANDRSLSAEAEFRLEQTFRDDILLRELAALRADIAVLKAR